MNSKADHIAIFKHIGRALEDFPLFHNVCFKPKQVQCLEYILNGFNVFAVLPTGYGKSLIFQMLPFVLSEKTPGKKNIVLVITPLSSIVKDQLAFLNEKGVKAAALPNNLHTNFGVDNAPKLFPVEGENQVIKLSIEFTEPSFSILFAHPEPLLSQKGRELLKSKSYQERIVACCIDEAHIVEMWGRDFRTEFSELAVIKTLIPDIPFVAVTATCTKSNVKKLSNDLCMSPNLKTVYENPNRSNIYLSLKTRRPTKEGFQGLVAILDPIAKELLKKQEQYPITVIYMQLQFCGKAYSHFEKVIGEKQYVGGVISPESRLFNQFHSPSTGLMKEGILEEIKSNSSRIRVLFATTALGMGVDARDIVHVIHIGPPSSIESYVQEFGRAGRSKGNSWATLFFNKSDIAANTHLNDDMRAYYERQLFSPPELAH
ncbi:uncharacterized protein [Clytia hemisphaerica]|uniref:uncharacterized protein n=1 Tax=Clytia hemisphaerica TaxID=252671 RepID=UPI0034D518D8